MKSACTPGAASAAAIRAALALAAVAALVPPASGQTGRPGHGVYAAYGGVPRPVGDSTRTTILLFPSGRRWDTGVRAVRYLARLDVPGGAPHFLLAGWDCDECDANEAIFVRSPARPRAPGDTLDTYVYPGKHYDDEDPNVVLIESRLFAGSCIPGRGPVVLQYATEYGAGERRRRVRITELAGSSRRHADVSDRPPPLARTLARVRAGACREIH